ncbi:MAG: hypothetical protein WCI73_14820, partial [Phycisphaerae bacterium]
CISCWWTMTQIHDSNGLIVASLMIAVTGCFYGAVDMMVYRTTHPKDMGSVTSTNSALRGLMIGISQPIAGAIIYRSGHNYNLAYLYAIAVSTLGFISILTYLWLKRNDVIQPEAGAEEIAATPLVEEVLL